VRVRDEASDIAAAQDSQRAETSKDYRPLIVSTGHTTGLVSSGTSGHPRRHVEYQVLGGVVARLGGRIVSTGSQQQRRLLGLLLVGRNEVVGLDRIADALWADGNLPRSPDRAVQSYVSRLRGIVGDATLTRHAAGYRLSTAEVSVDIDEFQRLVSAAHARPPAEALRSLRQALALWEGEPFGEFSGEFWTIDTAARLHELRRCAIEDCFGARLSLGEHREAVSEIESAVKEFPDRTELVGHLMIAQYRNGAAATAIRTFQQHRRLMVDTTGLEPAGSLIELERAILENQPTAVVGSSPRRIHGYELVSTIGTGPTATVYGGLQPVTQRPVIVKMIDAAVSSTEEFERNFDRQAQSIARLEHAHVVALYDFWREPGGAYLVYRFVDGGDLAAARSSGPRWTLDRTTRFVHQIASALSAGHRRGIAHGNLHDANVLFDDEGAAYVTDYPIGRDPIARSLSSSNDPHVADGHALLLLAWSVLAGRHPLAHERSSLGTVLRSVRPDLPSPLYDLFDTARVTDGYRTDDPASELVRNWNLAVNAGPQPLHEKRPSPVDNPYKGLRPFDESDTEDLFGRGELIVDIERSLLTHRFVALIGPSGAGKSSTVSAGVVPRLRSKGWGIESFQPGVKPVHALATVAQLAHVRAMRATPAESEGGDSDARDRPSTLIVIDQLEELLTVCGDASERSLFSKNLSELLAADGSVRVLASVRVDFLELLLQDAELSGLLRRGAVEVVSPMNARELEACVRGPAERRGLDVESSLVTQIVADVSARPGSMPLLQFALADLFEHSDHTTLTLAGYDDIGGVAGALARRAESAFASLPQPQQDALPDLLVRLVGVDEERPATGRSAPLRALDHTAQLLADELVRHRLLVSSNEPSTREPVVELAHESLLREWPRIRTWLDESRADHAMLRRIEAAARAWQMAGRVESDLFRGARLDTAVDWANAKPRSLTEVERDFLDESARVSQTVALHQRRSLRIVRRLSAGLTVLLVVAVATAGWAVLERRQADRSGSVAETRRLLATATRLATGNQPTALVLAVEGMRRSPGSIDAVDALATALRANSGSRGTAALPFPVQRITFTRDGSRVIGVGADGVVAVDAMTHRVVAQRNIRAAFGGDPLIVPGPGSTVIVADDAAELRLLDDTSLSDTTPPIAFTSQVRTLAATSSGDLIAVGGDFGSVVLIDTDDGDYVGEFATAARPVDLTFTSDDEQLLVGVELGTGGRSSIETWSVGQRTRLQHVDVEGAMVAFHAVGERVLISSETAAAREELSLLDLRTQRIHWRAAASSDGRSRVTIGTDGVILRGSTNMVSRIDADSGQEQLLQEVSGRSVTISPDNSTYAVLDTSASIRFGSLDGVSQLADALPDPPDTTCELDVSDDGRYAACNEPGRVWDLGAPGRPVVFSDDSNAAYLLSGRRLLSIGEAGAWQIRSLIDQTTLETGTANQLVHTSREEGRPSGAVTPDGQWFFTADRAHLWQVDIRANTSRALIGPDLASADPTYIVDVRVSDDSRTVSAQLGNGDILSWDVRARTTAGVVSFGGRSDGRRLLAATDNTASQLSDAIEGLPDVRLVSGATLTPIASFNERVAVAAFDAAGTWFATAETSGTVRLWDVTSRRSVGPAYNAAPGVRLRFLPAEPRRLLTSEPGRVLLWNLDETSWPALACQAAGRNLSPAEWRDVGPRDTQYARTCSQWPSPDR
jgi:DNA-binding SARP family transcriptional activator/WD40 repeat protein